MRNLSQRLREIVRADSASSRSGRPTSASSISYSSDGDFLDVRDAATALGGELHQSGPSTCIVIDRIWEGDHWHGRGRVSSFVPNAQAPIALFDPRVADTPEWARRPV